MGGFGIDRYTRPVTLQYKLYSKGSLSDKQVITIADEAEITVSSNMLLIYMFPLEAIVPRACTSMTRGLELEIWEQNYCLSTSGETAHALLMANETPSSNASSQRSSFSLRWTRVTEALGTRLVAPMKRSVYLENHHTYSVYVKTHTKYADLV